MKKIIIILAIMMISMSLFAGSYFKSSLGIAYLSLDEKVTYNGSSISGKEKTTAMALCLDGTFTGEKTKFGLNIGFSFLYPLSSSVNGVDVNIDFLNSNFCPRIGFVIETVVNDKFVLLSTFGYESMINYTSKYSSELKTYIDCFLLTHGVYGKSTFIYKLENNFSLHFGFGISAPIIGSQKISASGHESEIYKYTYSGVILTPFIGFQISNQR